MLRTACIGIALLVAAASARAAKVGAAAPDFSLTSRDGKQSALSGHKGKVLLINFWASWCAPCADELPELNQLAIDERGKEVGVIAINVDKDSGKARALLSQLNLESPALEILWDPDSKAVAAYNPETMPSSFVVDAGGIIRFVHAGFHDRDPKTWRKELKDLLGSPEKAPPGSASPPSHS